MCIYSLKCCQISLQICYSCSRFDPKWLSSYYPTFLSTIVVIRVILMLLLQWSRQFGLRMLSVFWCLLAIWSSSLVICLVTAFAHFSLSCSFLVDRQGFFLFLLIPLSLILLGMKEFFQLYFLPHRVACKDLSSPIRGRIQAHGR